MLHKHVVKYAYKTHAKLQPYCIACAKEDLEEFRIVIYDAFLIRVQCPRYDNLCESAEQ